MLNSLAFNLALQFLYINGTVVKALGVNMKLEYFACALTASTYHLRVAGDISENEGEMGLLEKEGGGC